MAYLKHVLFEVYMLALGSNLALKFPPLQGIKSCIVHDSQPIHKCLVFFASHRPYHCGGCSIDLFMMNIVLIKWPGKIYNFKWLVMDYPEGQWQKPGIKPNSAGFQRITFTI